MKIGVDPLPRGRSGEGESAGGLSLAALAFSEKMKREVGVRVSEKQLWPLNPAFVAGVPVAFAVDVARGRWHTEKPWDLATRLQREWAELYGAFRQVGRYRRGLGGTHPSPELLKRVAPYLTPAQVLWAKGEGEHADAAEPPAAT